MQKDPLKNEVALTKEDFDWIAAKQNQLAGYKNFACFHRKGANRDMHAFTQRPDAVYCLGLADIRSADVSCILERKDGNFVISF